MTRMDIHSRLDACCFLASTEMLDSRYYSLSHDLPSTLSWSARLSEPSYVMNGEVYSGEDPSTQQQTQTPSSVAKYRNANSTLAVLRPYMDDGQKVDGREEHEESKSNGIAVKHEQHRSSQMDLSSDEKQDSRVAASPPLNQLLSSAASTFNLHSATLLNLIQSSSLNPFEAMQKKVRRDYVLATGQQDQQDDVKLPAPASSVASPHVALLDSTLISFLTLQLSRFTPIWRSLEARYADDMRRFREAQRQAQVGAAAAAAGGAAGIPPAAAGAAASSAAAGAAGSASVAAAALLSTLTPAQLDAAARNACPRPHLPALPFVRKVYREEGTRSPYAPVGSEATAKNVNPIAGLIFTLPQIMHVYIELEDSTDEADVTVPVDPTSPSTLARSLTPSRLSVVHPSELSALVDAHALSSYALCREVQSQATVALWEMRERAEMEGDSAGGQPKELRVLQELLLWLSSFWDLYTRQCSACRLHLAPTAPHSIGLSVSSPFHPASTSAPIPNDSAIVLLHPTVRLLDQHGLRANQGAAGENSSGSVPVALHPGCVEVWRQQVGGAARA
jgi:hypothetical protein